MCTDRLAVCTHVRTWWARTHEPSWTVVGCIFYSFACATKQIHTLNPLPRPPLPSSCSKMWTCTALLTQRRHTLSETTGTRSSNFALSRWGTAQTCAPPYPHAHVLCRLPTQMKTRFRCVRCRRPLALEKNGKCCKWLHCSLSARVKKQSLYPSDARIAKKGRSVISIETPACLHNFQHASIRTGPCAVQEVMGC
jgi:hypothetical protein